MAQAIGGLVAAGAVLLEAFHDDPIEIAAEEWIELRRFDCDERLAVVVRSASGSVLEARGRAERFLLADGAAHSVQPEPLAALWASKGVLPVSSS